MHRLTGYLLICSPRITECAIRTFRDKRVSEWVNTLSSTFVARRTRRAFFFGWSSSVEKQSAFWTWLASIRTSYTEPTSKTWSIVYSRNTRSWTECTWITKIPRFTLNRCWLKSRTIIPRTARIASSLALLRLFLSKDTRGRWVVDLIWTLVADWTALRTKSTNFLYKIALSCFHTFLLSFLVLVVAMKTRESFESALLAIVSRRHFKLIAEIWASCTIVSRTAIFRLGCASRTVLTKRTGQTLSRATCSLVRVIGSWITRNWKIALIATVFAHRTYCFIRCSIGWFLTTVARFTVVH